MQACPRLRPRLSRPPRSIHDHGLAGLQYTPLLHSLERLLKERERAPSLYLVPIAVIKQVEDNGSSP